MLDFSQLALHCAPQVQEDTLAHVVQVESSFNPYAIGVVGGHLERQPRSSSEAIATAAWLESKGYNYSVGLAQINHSNFARYRLSLSKAFDSCANLRAAAAILSECFARAIRANPDQQAALRDSFSCYYSGNFTTGYKTGYVVKVIRGSAHPERVTPEARAEISSATGGPASALLF